MDRIKALKRRVSRLLKKSVNDDEDRENESSGLERQEERQKIRWTIENIHRYPLDIGEYHESPPFWAGHSKWTLRLYSEKDGLFMKRISSSGTGCDRHEFKVVDSIAIEVYFLNQCEFQRIEGYGTDEICLDLEFFSNVKFMTIECNILMTLLEAEKYQSNGKGIPNCNCTLSKDLRNLFHQKKHSDAILKIGDSDIPVHKAILAARSKMFSDMLRSSDVITIEHTESSPATRDLMEYIYTGTLDDFTFDKATSLYPVAKKCSLKELEALCVDKILATMSVANFCRIASLADIHQSGKMRRATTIFFCNYSAQILDGDDWKTFICEQRSAALELIDALATEIQAKCSNHLIDRQ